MCLAPSVFELKSPEEVFVSSKICPTPTPSCSTWCKNTASLMFRVGRNLKLHSVSIFVVENEKNRQIKRRKAIPVQWLWEWGTEPKLKSNLCNLVLRQQRIVIMTMLAFEIIEERSLGFQSLWLNKCYWRTLWKYI